jgi:ABC-type multidrug transport system ATPase subunit
MDLANSTLMKTCPHCQTPNVLDNKFCQQCGRPFSEPEFAPEIDASGKTVRWQGPPISERGIRRAVSLGSLFSARNKIWVGRSPDADVYLPHFSISRFHAELEKTDKCLLIRDFKSLNGVSVNGHRIHEPKMLHDQDRVGVGPFLFHLDGDKLLVIDNSQSLRLQASDLEKVVRDPQGKPRKLLDKINLIVEPGEFVSLLGPSGSGKSTLMDCLNGRRPATGGLVLANGENFYLHFDSFRQSLGYVPQKDIVHTQLSVYRALYYTALLRLPTDTDARELSARVEEVLQQMELQPHRNTLIGDLSGGQIKRVSLGAELIASPCLLFIDEATSGLDAGTEARMMRLFRQLSDEGKSLVCITHNVDNVDLCHLIVVLARGRLVFLGPPAEARPYFGVSRISEIYDRLFTREPEQWEKQYQESDIHKEFIEKRSAVTEKMGEWKPHQQKKPAPSSGVFTPLIQAVSAIKSPKMPRLTLVHQFRVLLLRSVELLWRDRATLRLLVLQAPIVAMFILLGFYDAPYDQEVLAPRKMTPSEKRVFETFVTVLEDGYEKNQAEIAEFDKERKIAHIKDMMKKIPEARGPVVPDRFIIDPRYTYMLLFLIVIIVMWFGCNNAAKEIVKERAIFSRECAVNLGILPYLASKFLVLCLFTAFQTLVLMLCIYGPMEWSHWHSGHPVPWPEYQLNYLQQYGVLVLLGINGAAVGLLLSACVKSPDRASTLLPYVLIPQIILGGGFLVIRDGLLFVIAAAVSPVYWAFRAVRTGETELPADLPITMQYQDSLWLPCTVLIAQTAVLLLLTFGLLRYQERKRS